MTIWTDRTQILHKLLLLEMERQLLIISSMIDRLRSRWGLPGGLPVIRQRRPRRYRFRPWPTWATWHIETSSRCRLSSVKSWSRESLLSSHLRDSTLMRDPVSPEVKWAVSLRHLATGDSYSMLSGWPVRPSRSLCLRSVTLSPGDAVPHTARALVAGRVRHATGGGTFHMPGQPWMGQPQGGGSLFRNCKGFHSIVLLAGWLLVS